MKCLVLDYGGTALKYGLIDTEANLTSQGEVPAPNRSAEEYLRVTGELYDRFKDEIEGIAVSMPGTFTDDGVLVSGGAYLGILKDQNIVDLIGSRCPVPVAVENDGKSAALAEAWNGNLKDCQDGIAIILGTGIGGGLVFDGHIFSGCGDVAGEIGHMIIQVDGEPCNCGKRGCWETYASASAIIRMVKQAMEEHPESLLHAVAREQGKIGAINLFLARDRGDAAACELFDRYVKYLSIGVGNLIAILQPERVIIGGGIIGQGEKLLAPLREQVYAELMQAEGKRTEILAATAGNDAGIIGAAMLDS